MPDTDSGKVFEMSQFTPPEWLTPREYQSEAVTAWMDAQGQGILNMATGTGKTITSLLAAAELASLQNGQLGLIVAAPYQHLVDQWVDELEGFGVTPFRAYKSRSQWLDEAASAITEFGSGVRDVFAVVTTHKTFGSDHFQRLVSRLDGTRTLLIADEVHHMGASGVRESLPEQIRARLGLSATPQRWYDEEGTTALMDYFSNGIVYEYGIEEAIANGYLSEYYYVPHIVHLTDEETEDYLALSRAIGQRLAGSDDEISTADLETDEQLQQLLFKRARLIGTAENKLHHLRSLLEESDPASMHHTLVYCGDGKIRAEGEDVKRQIRAVTELLGTDLGIKAHQFTYEEDQATRERLLSGFEQGDLQALVAIRCLDEGVDVPATQTAFMLASSTNPRQFVQRRGRILRPHESKDHAIIHDFIVAPPNQAQADGGVFDIERNLLKRELERVSTFAEMAKNHPDATLSSIPTSNGSISDLKQDFNLMDI